MADRGFGFRLRGLAGADSRFGPDDRCRASCDPGGCRRRATRGRRTSIASRAGQQIEAVTVRHGLPRRTPAHRPRPSTRDAAVDRGRAHHDRAALAARRHGVLHAVLDERLQRQPWHLRRPRRRRRARSRSAGDRRSARARCRGRRGRRAAPRRACTSGVAVLSSAERSSAASWPVIRSAPAGSSWTSAAIEFSVLNRKCGCTRDSIDASCASAASRRASASSRSFVRSATVASLSRERIDSEHRGEDAEGQRDEDRDLQRAGHPRAR